MSDFKKDSSGEFWIEKDPQATLDYSMDWTAWLQSGETIQASTWTISTGLTHVSDSNSTAVATIWLSGGVVGNEYVVTNKITTSAGRVDERSFRIRIKRR